MSKISLKNQSVCQKIGYIHKEAILGMAMNPDKSILVTSDGEGQVKQHDIAKSKFEL